MCEKCLGNGRYYKVDGISVTIIPCHCEHSEPIRELRAKDYQDFLIRFEAAKNAQG